MSSRRIKIRKSSVRVMKKRDRLMIESDPDIEEVTRLFCHARMSDGLPIIPPTRERVGNMLKYSDKDRSEVLGAIPPKLGKVTVEAIAVNAVMAGCTSTYFPVVIAAVEAILEPRFNLKGIAATTHPVHPLIIVNGPIRKKLAINSGFGCFGPGYRANATIGRAITLCLINIGGAFPGIGTYSTHGSPARFSYCIAENEEKSPWEPLHVEKGFSKDVSTVFALGGEPPHNINDHRSKTAKDLLTIVAACMINPGSNPATKPGEILVIFGPEHAKILGDEGWTKDDIRWFLFERARNPIELFTDRGGMPPSWPKWAVEASNGRIPVVTRPEEILITCAGGSGKHTVLVFSFGAFSESVIKPITPISTKK